jgi:hypothetical protein
VRHDALAQKQSIPNTPIPRLPSVAFVITKKREIVIWKWYKIGGFANETRQKMAEIQTQEKKT